MIKEFTGKLILRDALHNEDLDKFRFVLRKEPSPEDNADTAQSFALTTELDALLNKKCGLVINWADTDWVDETHILQRYNGLLMFNNKVIDHILMDLEGENIAIFIDDLTDCEDGYDLHKVS
jgi:hypothetical protein